MSREQSVCIIGCGRDVAQHWPAVSRNLERLASQFRKSETLLFENDSEDETKELVQQWVNRDQSRALHSSNVIGFIPSRTKRLAWIRNYLMRAAVATRTDFILVVDLDDRLTKPIEHIPEMQHDWDVMTAKSEPYYDIWALRLPGVMDADCWSQPLRAGSDIERCRKHMEAVTQPIEVESAFCGAALYRSSIVRPCCRYVGDSNGAETCEHVSFHRCLRSHGAKIVFNPQFRI